MIVKQSLVSTSFLSLVRKEVFFCCREICKLTALNKLTFIFFRELVERELEWKREKIKIREIELIVSFFDTIKRYT